MFNFFVKDPSNSNENFKRIRIRSLIENFKKEGLDKKKLKLTIRNLEDSNQSINFYVKKNIDQNTKFFNKKNAFILNKFFFDQSHEVIFRSLSLLLKSIGEKYYVARGKSIDNLIEKIVIKNIFNQT